MSKQLILITAPFNCGYCKTAQKELPELCKKHGFELIEMEDEKSGDKNKDLPVDIYPTILFRVNEKITKTLNGYSKNNILTEIKKH